LNVENRLKTISQHWYSEFPVESAAVPLPFLNSDVLLSLHELTAHLAIILT